MHILVIDDKKSVRDCMTKSLTSLGYTVTTAVNGLDGFEKAQQAPFSLYVIDHLMPLMNGVTLSKNLKQTPYCKDTPILFITTQSKTSVESSPEFDLFDDIVSKPLTEIEFISAVKSLINNTPKKIAL